MTTPQLTMPKDPHRGKKDKKSFSWGILGIIILQIAILFFIYKAPQHSMVNETDSDYLKKAALKLEELGLKEQAVNCWNEYVNKSSLKEDAQATIYLRMAKMLQNEKKYDRAVQFYFLAKQLNKNEEVETEIVRNVSNCLEGLQRFAAMTIVMKEKVAAGYEKKEDAHIIAQIGSIELDKDDLSQIIDGEISTKMETMKIAIPQLASQQGGFFENMRKQYDSPEAQQQILQEHLMEEVLWREALESGLGDDKAYQKKINLLQRKILSSSFLQMKVTRQIVVLPEEIKAVYESQKQQFLNPEKANVSLKVFLTKEEAEAFLNEATEELFKDVTPVEIFRSTEKLEDYGDISELVTNVLESKAKGLHSQVYETDKGVLVAWVNSYDEETTKSLQEVQDTIQQQIWRQKYQQIMSNFVEYLFDKHKVKIYQKNPQNQEQGNGMDENINKESEEGDENINKESEEGDASEKEEERE